MNSTASAKISAMPGYAGLWRFAGCGLLLLCLAACSGEARGASFDINGPTLEMRQTQFCIGCGKHLVVNHVAEGETIKCPSCKTMQRRLPKAFLATMIFQVCPKCAGAMDVHGMNSGSLVQCPRCGELQSVISVAAMAVPRSNPPVLAAKAMVATPVNPDEVEPIKEEAEASPQPVVPGKVVQQPVLAPPAQVGKPGQQIQPGQPGQPGQTGIVPQPAPLGQPFKPKAEAPAEIKPTGQVQPGQAEVMGKVVAKPAAPVAVPPVEAAQPAAAMAAPAAPAGQAGQDEVQPVAMVQQTQVVENLSGDPLSAEPAKTESILRVAAVVNGTPIPANELELRLSYALEEERIKMGGEAQNSRGYRRLLKLSSTLRQDILDCMIDETLVVQKAKVDGVQPDEAKVERFAEKMNLSGRKLPADDTIMVRARTQATLEETLVRLAPSFTPPPSKIQDYYEDHIREFSTQPYVRLRALVIYNDRVDKRDGRSANQIMDSLLRELQKGDDFETLTRKHSEDIFAKEGGVQGVGEASLIPEASLASPLRAALAAANPGEVRGPVALSNAVVLFRLEERQGGQPRKLAEVQREITERLVRTHRLERLHAFVADLRRNAKITIF